MQAIKRCANGKRFAWRHAAAVLIGVSAVSLGGCGTSSLKGSSDALTTGSTGAANVEATTKAGKAWQRDPKNVKLGLAYAERLKTSGTKEKRLQVLATLAGYHPQNVRVQSDYGIALLQAGQPKRAINALKPAAKSSKADWRTYSALGSAYDQTGDHDRARRYYDLALKKNPYDLRIWNNLGMSHILSGDPVKAEEIFRKADAAPDSKKFPQIRQNLGLAVGLQGRFEDAKKIVSRDLPPDQVQANIDHLQTLLSGQNTWQELQSDG